MRVRTSDPAAAALLLDELPAWLAANGDRAPVDVEPVEDDDGRVITDEAASRGPGRPLAALTLLGATVLIGRPAEGVAELARPFLARGARLVLFPLTSVTPIAGAHLAPAIAALLDGGVVVVTSAHAVPAVAAARPLPPGVRVAAVGAASARALAAAGLHAVTVGDGTAVDLAAALVRAGVSAVVHAAAAEPRPELGIALRAAGVLFTAVAVYQTSPVPAARAARLTARLARGDVDVFPFLAPSQVDAFHAALGAAASPTLARARVVAAVGPTTRDALLAHGSPVHVVASVPSAEALADAVAAGYVR